MSDPRPTLTLSLANFGAPPGPDGWRQLLDQARAADEAGIDRLLVVDHVVMGSDTSAYGWGDFRFPAGTPWLEPLAVLGALAAVTERVRLGTGVVIAPLRPAVVLAKSVATLDVLSHGRIDLGVGVGWQRAEYDAAGVSFPRRGRVLTDTMGACRALWGGSPASFSSETVAFDDLWCDPQPVQERLPVWFAGSLNERNLGRILGLGDGWLPVPNADPGSIAPDVLRLHAAWRDAGREGRPDVQMRVGRLPSDPEEGGLEAMMERAAALVAAGATDIRVGLSDLSPAPSELATRLRAAVQAFARAVA